MSTTKTLLCIVGATASGKTSIAIKLAKYLKTEIISADSRQFYRELSIGTAKPSPAELSMVPHHFINNKSITENYNAGDFEKEALQKIDELFLDHNIVILVGGSGMYIDAVTRGFDPLPKVNDEIREDIISKYKQEGINYLQKEIQTKDPVYFKKVDIQNPQRLMRALEVIYATGKPFTEFHLQNSSARNFNIVTLGLAWERETLYNRINSRVDMMIKEGLAEETNRFIEYKNQYALRSVGYTEFFDFFEGKMDLTNTINLVKQHTRNFAKRQLTWFRRNTDTIWINACDENAIFEFLNTITE